MGALGHDDFDLGARLQRRIGRQNDIAVGIGVFGGALDVLAVDLDDARLGPRDGRDMNQAVLIDGRLGIVQRGLERGARQFAGRTFHAQLGAHSNALAVGQRGWEFEAIVAVAVGLDRSDLQTLNLDRHRRVGSRLAVNKRPRLRIDLDSGRRHGKGGRLDRRKGGIVRPVGRRNFNRVAGLERRFGLQRRHARAVGDDFGAIGDDGAVDFGDLDLRPALGRDMNRAVGIHRGGVDFRRLRVRARDRAVGRTASAAFGMNQKLRAVADRVVEIDRKAAVGAGLAPAQNGQAIRAQDHDVDPGIRPALDRLAVGTNLQFRRRLQRARRLPTGVSSGVAPGIPTGVAAGVSARVAAGISTGAAPGIPTGIPAGVAAIAAGMASRIAAAAPRGDDAAAIVVIVVVIVEETGQQRAAAHQSQQPGGQSAAREQARARDRTRRGRPGRRRLLGRLPHLARQKGIDLGSGLREDGLGGARGLNDHVALLPFGASRPKTLDHDLGVVFFAEQNQIVVDAAGFQVLRGRARFLVDDLHHLAGLGL